MKLKFIVPIAVLVIAFLGCKKNNSYLLDPLFDLDVRLQSVGKSTGAGLIKFRQDPDTIRVISLDTWVTDLLPNHSYQLQRAVNPIADVTGCSSTTWLTLGEGLQPKSIVTNAHGDGHAKLWRDISGIARGTAFHIHFQILDQATLSPVLTSDCYDYTVR